MESKIFEEIKKLCKEDSLQTRYVGLRGLYDTDNYQVGDQLKNSYLWDDGEYTDVELSGTSACFIQNIEFIGDDIDEIDLNAIKKALSHVTAYGDGKIALIAGDYSEGGNDVWANEHIIHDAKIVAFL